MGRDTSVHSVLVWDSVQEAIMTAILYDEVVTQRPPAS